MRFIYLSRAILYFSFVWLPTMTTEPVNVANLSGGPAFQLTLEIGFGHDSSRMAHALSAFWESPRVSGPWLDSASFGDMGLASASPGGILSDQNYFGILSLDCGKVTLPFALFSITEEGMKTVVDGKTVPFVQNPATERSAWLTLNIPAAQLSKHFSIDRSWTLRSQRWLRMLCDAFAEIANSVHARVPLISGALGEEVSGCFRFPTKDRLVHAHQDYPPLAVMSADIIEKRGGVFVNKALWQQLHPMMDPIILPSGLRYFGPQLDAPLLGA